MTKLSATNSFSNMAQQYTVQVGDSASAIARRFNVPLESVHGYRSQDPNVIFPGEVLTINSATPAPQPAPATPQVTTDGSALLPPAPTPGAPVAPTVAPGAPQTPQILAAPVPGAPVAPQAATQPAATPPATAPAIPEPQTPATRTFKTPSGAVIDETGQVIETPVEQGLDEILQELANTDPEKADAIMDALGYSTGPTGLLKQYGVDPKAIESGFATNPMATLSSLVQQVMQMTGLTDVRKNITDIALQIEEVENQRDDEIRIINDNPFTSATTKQQLAQQVMDRYDQKIDARVNRLTLLQNAYQQARQEAQFAVTTAVGFYDKERNFKQDQLEFMIDRIEKAEEAKNKLTEFDSQRYRNVGNGLYDLKEQKFIVQPTKAGVSAQSEGFSDAKIESSVREDAATLLEEVDTGARTLDSAYKKLRLLYSENEASDEALQRLLGINEDGTTGEEIIPGSEAPLAGTKPVFSGVGGAGSTPAYFTSGTAADTNPLYNFLFSK